MKTCDGFNVEVLCRCKVPTLFLYKIKLTNDTENTVSYDMQKICSPHGDNLLGLDANFTHDGIGLLQSGGLAVGESVEGLIGLRKNLLATNRPRIFYSDTKIVG